MKNRTAKHFERKFLQSRLAQYPWPQRCIHYNGGVLTGLSFQRLLEKSHINYVTTSSINPQANAVFKRMHQTVGNILRTILHINHLKHYVGKENE